MASPREFEAMDRAIALSARGLGAVAPNPVVGCVVLDAAGDIAGEGWHQQAGGPHAEIAALAEAGDRAAGGTAVVTLEPCHHVGRTGPCTEALITAGIARVVFAVEDPNPEADGGAEHLAECGVEVEGGVNASQAAVVNRAWLTSIREGRPFVTIKLAMSLDGRIAAKDGTSRWISGAASRADAHRLRAQSDAVMVGTGTVLADDPALTVRDVPEELRGRSPLRVVVGMTPLPVDVQATDSSAPSLVLATRDLRGALSVLHERGICSVLVEGGPTLATALFEADLVDAVVAYVAPVLLGDGLPALGSLGIESIGEALRLHEVALAVIDNDVRIEGLVERKG